MAREIPSEALGFYEKLVAYRDANTARLIEETNKRIRVKQIFEQGVNVLEEFGIAPGGFRGIGTEAGLSGIRVYTPSVALVIEGNEVNFTIQGFKPNYLSPNSSSPDSYEYISVNKVVEGDLNFEIDNAWLFRIRSREIKAPFSKVSNDHEVIEAASGLINVISQSLLETHTPRSQQAKPDSKPSLFQRIFSPGKA